MFRRASHALTPSLVLGGVILLCAATASAQVKSPVTGEMAWRDGYWATAEVLSANRAGNVLTVSLRFVAGEGIPAHSRDAVFYSTYQEGVEKIYVVAGDKKYFTLSDTAGTPLIPQSFTLSFKQGQARGVWSGKFPAPPADIKQVSLVFPLTANLDDIPVTDR